MSGDAPLPSSTLATSDASGAVESSEPAPAASTTPARPAAPQFKLSTFILAFLFFLGLYMLFDNQVRNQFAGAIGSVLSPIIGFSGQYLLLTMLLAAIIEMLITALAYNWATDWIKAAKVGSWNTAFRKVQMEALKSGKKDRIEALKPHQQRLTMLSSEVSLAQLKGMAVTWFLIVAIYTWVGLFIAAHAVGNVADVNIGGTSVNLLGDAVGNFLPLWFLLFSLYTIPSSIALRRVLKHWSLTRRPASPTAGAPGAAGGAA